MIHSYLHFILLILALTTSWHFCADAQDIPRPPIQRCDQFLKPTYSKQVLVFSSQTYAPIQNHPIHQLARQLQEKKIRLVFESAQSLDGYIIQGKMLYRLIQEIFPTLPIHLDPPEHQIKIRLNIDDTALRGRMPTPYLNDFEMSRLKSGNPFIAPLSKQQVRTELNIPTDSKVVSFYADSELFFERAFFAISSKPQIVILSTKKTSLKNASRLSRNFRDYQIIELTQLQKQKSFIDPTQKYIIFNDSKYRMMEVYTASDYAVVVGSNNIFEPLQNSRPVIYFKNDWMESALGTWIGLFGNSILTGYDPKVWRKNTDTADETHGAIGINHYSELSKAMKKAEKIRPEDILHPAFVVPEENAQSNFDDILDQLERLIRFQLKMEGISID